MSSSTSERKADVPPFEVGSVVFTCFAQIEQPGTPYVWRSSCRRLAVGRIAKLRIERDDDGHEIERAHSECWARLDGVLIKSDYPSLKTAMIMAALSLSNAKVAA